MIGKGEVMKARALTEDEMELVARIAAWVPEDRRDQLLYDAAHSMVKVCAKDRAMLEFDIKGYDRPPYRGKDQFMVDARLFDADNAEINVFVYTDENGRLLELEYMRWDMKEVICPQLDMLSILGLLEVRR